MEESHRAEEKAQDAVYRSLETEFEKLRQEYEKSTVLVSSHDTAMKELQAKIDSHGEDFNLQLQAHDAALISQKEVATLKEKELTTELLAAKAEYEVARVSLLDEVKYS